MLYRQPAFKPAGAILGIAEHAFADVINPLETNTLEDLTRSCRAHADGANQRDRSIKFAAQRGHNFGDKTGGPEGIVNGDCFGTLGDTGLAPFLRRAYIDQGKLVRLQAF